jgi:hypothetical protein
MRRARCPYCNNVNVIAEADWGQIARCEAPRCGRIYQSGAAQSLSSVTDATSTPPASPRRRPAAPSVTPLPKPRLTGPHVCHACQGEINQALAHRRATIVHRRAAQEGQPAGAPCRMDVYAALYYCPNPSCQTFLETPSYQWGREVTCPACQSPFLAPLDDVLHEHAGDAREGQGFRFRCPSCDATLQCDSTREGKPVAGLRVVCRFCHIVIDVPAGGVSLGPQALATPDPQEALHHGGSRRCSNPACGQIIPARAERCPVCEEIQHDLPVG